MVVLGSSLAYARVRQLEMKNSTPDRTVNKVMENKDNSMGAEEGAFQKVL